MEIVLPAGKRIYGNVPFTKQIILFVLPPTIASHFPLVLVLVLVLSLSFLACIEKAGSVVVALHLLVMGLHLSVCVQIEKLKKVKERVAIVMF